jgi:DNA uptake protein ComE-like DNA-binding protein
MASPATVPENRVWWPWVSLVPLGLGCWAPIYGGLKVREPVWVLAGVLWTLLLIAGFVLNGTSSHPGSDDLAGACFIAAWVGGAATSFGLRRPYMRRTASPLQDAEASAQERLQERERARRIVRDHPALAVEMGIGRPDRPGSTDFGLVDVNNVPAATLSTLAGIDDALAARIVKTRAEVHGFSSLEDMGTVMDLDADLVDALRDRTVFLTRE